MNEDKGAKQRVAAETYQGLIYCEASPLDHHR